MSEKVRIILARITDFPQVRFKLSVNMDRDAVPDHSKSPLFKLNLMRPLTVTLNNKCTVPLYTPRRIPLGALFTAFQSVKKDPRGRQTFQEKIGQNNVEAVKRKLRVT
jgi:hypothetical protein